MKNKFKIILFLAMSAILTSCDKDEDSDVSAPESYITATVDGASFTTVVNGISTAKASRLGSGSGSSITVLGLNSAGNSIGISLEGVVATGTYTANPASDYFIKFVDASSETNFGTETCELSSGTITVTTLTNTLIEGTFSFNAIGSKLSDDSCNGAVKKVTNGSFRAVILNIEK